jgi:hypothetical protein
MPDPEIPDRVRRAARRVIAADGGEYSLQGWQVAYLLDVGEGRAGRVPPGCGVGRGWLEARLAQAAADESEGEPGLTGSATA